MTLFFIVSRETITNICSRPPGPFSDQLNICSGEVEPGAEFVKKITFKKVLTSPSS